MQPYSQTIACFLVAASMSAGLPVSAADDAYLRMLNSEAANVQLDTSGQLKPEKTNNRGSAITSFEWDGAVEKQGFPSGLGQDAFESFLHKYYFGTYVFFRKLDPADKETVYFRYSKEASPNIDNVRQNVMTLLRK